MVDHPEVCVEFSVRVMAVKILHDTVQPDGCNERGQGHAHMRAALSAELAHLFPRAVERCHHQPRIGEQAAPGLGELGAVDPAFEQLGADVILELAQGARYRALTEIELARGAPDRARGGECEKGPELSETHGNRPDHIWVSPDLIYCL